MLIKNLVLFSICLGSLLIQPLLAHTLLVGTNAEFPPYATIEQGEIVGFDIDVAKEVATRLGKEIKFKDVPFDALIPELAMGRVDFVAAGLTSTPERAKRVLFTRPYISEDPLVILTTAKNKWGLDDLKGKNVVVIEGFTADLFMSNQDHINLTRLPTQADGFLALKSGRADAFVTAKSTLQTFFEKQDPTQFQVTVIEGTGDNCVLAISKSKPELLVAIQDALDAMEKEGTLEQLKTKWKLK